MIAPERPNSIKNLKQWVCWRSEERDGKPTKIPYSPLTSRRASSTDPETWAGYDEAVEARKNSGYDGVGFVFTPDDPYTGVDLDGCRNPKTGGLEPWAREIVQTLNSYAEVSPSGTGVHVILRGTLPAGRNRNGRFETYDKGRYFTFTGEHIPGSSETIESRQGELNDVLRGVFGPESPNSRSPRRPLEWKTGSRMRR